MNCIKCLLIGDSGSGKSSLVVTYLTKQFIGDDVCRAYDNASTNIIIDGKHFKLRLSDTSGQEDYPNLRALSYPQTQIFLCLFSVVDPSSLKSIKQKYLPEVRKQCPKASIILLGTKTDLRDDPEMKSISFQEGKEIAKELGVEYMECSSRHQIGVSEIFTEAVRIVMNKDKKDIVQKEKRESYFKISSKIKKHTKEITRKLTTKNHKRGTTSPPPK